MSLHPYGAGNDRRTLTPCNRAWERSRLEWRISDGGDPAVVVTEWLARYGLGRPTGPGTPHAAREVCGAMIFVSAAAGARMVGSPAGAPSPAPAVPDAVAVVYAHGDPWPAGPAPGPESDPAPWSAGPAPEPALRPAGPEAGAWWLGPWSATWSADVHADAVTAVRAAIARGDVYQVNVVGHASAPYAGDPGPALRRVAGLPGARHGGILTGTGWAIASASPEALVRVSGDVVETRPIKGTRPATAEGRRQLLHSTKERAEHVMIVDLARNDLARVARTGSVVVPDLFAVRRWCDLWQAESRVAARLADGVDLAALLRAVCPGGSVTGAPKLAALAHIAELEPVGRGPSMGALGWLDPDRLDLGLTIRTVAVDGDRVHLWAGGGVTWDSDPDAEVAEAAAKAAPLRAALA